MQDRNYSRVFSTCQLSLTSNIVSCRTSPTHELNVKFLKAQIVTLVFCKLGCELYCSYCLVHLLVILYLQSDLTRFTGSIKYPLPSRKATAVKLGKGGNGFVFAIFHNGKEYAVKKVRI